MDLIKGFIKSYCEEYFLEVDIQYPEEWHKLHDNVYACHFGIFKK